MAQIQPYPLLSIVRVTRPDALLTNALLVILDTHEVGSSWVYRTLYVKGSAKDRAALVLIPAKFRHASLSPDPHGLTFEQWMGVLKTLRDEHVYPDTTHRLLSSWRARVREFNGSGHRLGFIPLHNPHHLKRIMESANYTLGIAKDKARAQAATSGRGIGRSRFAISVTGEPTLL